MNAARTALDVLPMGILELSNDLRVVTAEPRFCQVFQCEQEDVQGLKLDELCDPSDRAGVSKLLRGLAQHGGRWVDVHLTLRIRAGEVYVRMRVKRESECWVAVVEKALDGEDLSYHMLLAQQRWESLLRASDAGIALLDLQGRLLEGSAQFFALMKFRSSHGVALTEGAAQGREFNVLVDDCEGWQDLCRNLEVLREGTVEVDGDRGLFRRKFRYRDRLLDVRLRPIVLPHRGLVGSCLVVHDVSEQDEVEAARLQQAQAAGRAEISTNILHNLGNLCGGVILAMEELNTLTKSSKLDRLSKANDLFAERLESSVEFWTRDGGSQALLEYYGKLADAFEREQRGVAWHVKCMTDQIRLMQEAIAAQQNYARGSSLVEELNLVDVIQRVLDIQAPGLRRHGIQVKCSFAEVPRIKVQRNPLTHILLNLVKNAKEAMHQVAEQRLLRVEVRSTDENTVEARFVDNGEGIEHDKLDTIFVHGVTTKDSGHGFGLHFCATEMQAMGGSISATSDGRGRGACFSLRFPT